MKPFSILILLALCVPTLGCGSESVPQPPALDAETRDAIAQEDQSIDDAEANQ
tara:strand:- start:3216 stop:3374 length:159 start_codon:yes stop_codon:yes gene_type:complete